MTVSTETTKSATVVGNGVTTAFPFAFKIFQTSDVSVVLADVVAGVETVLTEGVDYSVSMNVDQEGDPGGEVTYPLSGSPMASTHSLTLVRDVPATQGLDLTLGGSFNPDNIEKALDRVTTLVQQLKEAADRAIKVSVSSDADMTLPSPAANYLLGWNSTATGLENKTGVSTPTIVSAYMAALLEASAAADARALLGTYEGSAVSFIQAGTGAVTRVAQDKMREVFSVKDFGAVGDGVTDDTEAFELCLAAVFASGRGATIVIPPGTYEITRSLRLHPDGSSRTWKNILFLGQGDGYASHPSVMLRYRATSVTDPSNYANGVFDVVSGVGINFEGICFLNDAVGVNQLVWLHAEDAGLLSHWKSSFRRCGFQNTALATKELANGHVYLYNALDVKFDQCWFFGSPQCATLGADPATISGIAGGYTGRVTFDSCYLTGDVTQYRTEITNYIGCTFAEKWANPSPFTEGASIQFPDETYSRTICTNVIGCQFEGLYSPSTFTDGAIYAADGVRGLLVEGCSFGSSYSRGIKVLLGTTGVVVSGNYFDLSDSVNAKAVSIASNFVGSIKISDNVLSPAMVADGGDLLIDHRTYEYPHVVDVQASGNYNIVAANTWESALSSSAVSYAAGLYRVRAGAILEGGAANTNMGLRITNSAGFVSETETMGTVQSGEVMQHAIDQEVYLPEGSAVTWDLQAREQTTSAGIVRGLGLGLTPGTYLSVTYLG